MTQFIKSNMETKLNIAEILKNKPKGTKLYADAFGELSIRDIDVESEPSITLLDESGYILYFYSNGKYCLYGEPILVPSKSMRDWSKFTWKKGDLLVNSCGFQCIFKEWASNDYTKFNGCYSNSRDGYEDISNARTDKFDKLDNNVAYGYIREIERRLGGKLNLDTLGIEKAQPEFKKGDIAFADYGYKQAVFIVSGKTDLSEGYNSFIALDLSGLTLDMGCRMSFFKKKLSKLRLATDSEKQRLFEALAKEGKVWDAKEKQVVDLKPKVEFKPFDKVLVRDCSGEIWRPSFFARYLPYGRDPYQVIGGERVKLCIPYEGNESLLGTTKDIEG